jgi:hypothetical protein
MQAPPESNTRQELLLASRSRVAHVQELCRRSLQSCRRSAMLGNLAREAFHRLESRALFIQTHSHNDG